jgi:hypothetical protein
LVSDRLIPASTVANYCLLAAALVVVLLATCVSLAVAMTRSSR